MQRYFLAKLLDYISRAAFGILQETFEHFLMPLLLTLHFTGLLGVKIAQQGLSMHCSKIFAQKNNAHVSCTQRWYKNVTIMMNNITTCGAGALGGMHEEIFSGKY